MRNGSGEASATPGQPTQQPCCFSNTGERTETSPPGEGTHSVEPSARVCRSTGSRLATTTKELDPNSELRMVCMSYSDLDVDFLAVFLVVFLDDFLVAFLVVFFVDFFEAFLEVFLVDFLEAFFVDFFELFLVAFCDSA